MSHAQDYVDALRAGCYFKALELAAFVSQKYQSMKKSSSVPMNWYHWEFMN